MKERILDWYCDCSKRIELPESYLARVSFDPDFRENPTHEHFVWDSYSKHIVRTSIMGYKFGNWQQIMLQLRHTGVTDVEVHRYVH